MRVVVNVAANVITSHNISTRQHYVAHRNSSNNTSSATILVAAPAAAKQFAAVATVATTTAISATTVSALRRAGELFRERYGHPGHLAAQCTAPIPPPRSFVGEYASTFGGGLLPAPAQPASAPSEPHRPGDTSDAESASTTD